MIQYKHHTQWESQNNDPVQNHTQWESQNNNPVQNHTHSGSHKTMIQYKTTHTVGVTKQ